MFVLGVFIAFLAGFFTVEAIPVVFKESTPNGESIVSISSSDPNVEKYWMQQLATRSGFTQIDDAPKEYSYQRPSGNGQNVVHSSYSIAGPGKAVATAGRSFASASSGPFIPLFTFPIAPDQFGYNFDIKNWLRSVDNFYEPNFPGNGQGGASASATAVNDNGHVYGNVKTVTADNKAKTLTFDNNVRTSNFENNKYKSKQ